MNNRGQSAINIILIVVLILFAIWLFQRVA
jgi:flagellar biogenesis protein FliO